EQAVPAAAAAGAKANPDGGGEAGGTEQPPQGQTSDQVDDLLFPTEEELAASKAGIPDAGAAAKPEVAAKAAPAAGAAKAVASPESEPAAEPQAQAAAAVSFESGIDAESWAEYGGWYRQDYAIYYRPTGHKDKFIHAWLGLTGPQAPRGGTSPAAAVFDSLTGKDAQGSCTKCHSVDDVRGKGRFVNFLPISVEKKRGRFTNFVHEPHFGIMDNRGCLTCHSLEKNRPYLQSYEQGNPRRFVSGFGPVKKELCQTCHASGMARQDCLLCHKYHVNGTTMPITSTQNLAQ
ncbi:MAG TPA: hypothetical protein VJS40_00500, partial [Aestuariivirgaceae bacterium]|nr:hypothetical protein [Aestuariivirgaceae bacterium]